MSHTPHELAEEFPELTAKIHDLKTTDAHFRHLADHYHALNRAIHRAETKVEPIDAMAEENMRKQRLRLKDELYAMLSG